MVDIVHQLEQTRFVATDAGKVIAEMTYSPLGDDRFIIDHTDVDQAYGGQGIGYQLVDAAVAHARANGMKILPLCPFAASVFKKKGDEYADVRF
ncbi:GNAT family N-acetyltransferase [Jeongeupia sp. USM3]|uniref:GNAT family N-acetyltransferase n=1 Tax=Jeongeupia sp. USM3 TaxID=1906741 RepID=UPI00089DE3BC|nr:GNAT family N-acetyltransferase [Jeongeupia sp. USM3]AOY00077.1 GNAT family N-acetyltransferase [Jeongeupia sp. USM3]